MVLQRYDCINGCYKMKVSNESKDVMRVRQKLWPIECSLLFWLLSMNCEVLLTISTMHFILVMRGIGQGIQHFIYTSRGGWWKTQSCRGATRWNVATSASASAGGAWSLWRHRCCLRVIAK